MSICNIAVGGEFPFTARGELKTGGARSELDFTYGGDRYNIVCVGNCVEYARGGSVNVKMRLDGGGRSSCVISQGDLLGSIPVEAERVDVQATPDGLNISLKYEIGGKKTVLEIAAVTEK